MDSKNTEKSCTCKNWCKDGEPTPYPLTSRDTPDVNETGEHCKKCHFYK